MTFPNPINLRALGACAAAIALSLTLLACKPPDGQGRQRGGVSTNGGPGMKEPREERVFLAPVLARSVERGEILASVASTGSVVPLRSRLLRAEESGRLKFTQQWQEGDAVKQGDLIATLVAETLVGEIARAEADMRLQEEQLNIGKKSMDQAMDAYQTTQVLYARGIAAEKEVSEQELSMQRAVNTHRQNQINLLKAQTELVRQREKLERLEIRAPFDGLLVARTTLEGSKPFATTFGTETITDYDGRLVSNDFTICGVIDTSTVVIRCDVTSRDIAKIRLGQEARAVIYGTSDIVVTGEVTNISRSVNSETRAFEVDILVENPEAILKPGMFGRVDVIYDRKLDAVSIPKDIISRRNNQDVVFVVKQATEEKYQVAREVPIELGLEGRDTIEVTWGLQAGDGIIVRGFEVLQDNSPIAPIYDDEPLRPDSVVDKSETTAATP